MGQNSSQLGSSSPRRRISSPTRRKAPPTPAPPPKPPAYVVAENCVLPGGATDMAGARKLLRPVSQELTKFHPDFADIFAYDSEVDGLPRGGDGGEVGHLSGGEKSPIEGSGVSHLTDVTPGRYQHAVNKSGEGRNGQASFVSDGSTDTDTESSANQLDNTDLMFPSDTSTTPHQARGSGVGLRRTQSMEARPRLQAGRNNQGKFHRRQLSVTPVIPEDPREHLYNITRNEPFSNALPASASLPLASSFGLDYSFNVTYAQLADFRRKQREEEMGDKMEVLSAEIKASNTVPKSPFDRTNIGEKSATRSVSTGSSETGVSKSKKKKAPAPPPPANVPPLTRKAPRDQSPSKLSMTTEPPADYDMGTDVSPPQSPPSSARALHRSFSSAGEYDSRNNSSNTDRLRDRNSGHDSNPPPPASAQPPPPPPPLPAPPLPGQPGALKFPTQTSKEVQPSSPVVKSKVDQTFSTTQTGFQKSITEAKAQIEELKRLQEILKTGDNVKQTTVSSAADSTTEDKKASPSDKDSELRISTGPPEPPKPAVANESVAEEAGNKPSNSSTVSTPRMSSLLQHDIVLAAQARGAKVVKAKPPPALEKPKDMAEIFREELAKAAQAREDRRNREVARDDCDNNNNRENKEDEDIQNKTGDPSFIFQSSFLKVAKKPPQTLAKPDLKALANHAESKEIKHNDKIKTDGALTKENIGIAELEECEEREERDSSIVSKRSSIQSEDMSISSSNASQRVFLPSWTPEHDLDSDDDIMNESTPPFTRVFGETRKDSSAGFKSSVLPTKIDSLKKDKNKNKKERGDKQRKIKDHNMSSPRQQVPENVDKFQNSRLEGSQNSSDKEEKKFGNLRKFQKGVKQAFGSISKASGKLLKRRKSQDILDIPADVSSAVQHHGGVSTDPNWTLGDSASNPGSLRRVASEGHMPVQDIYQNGHASGFKSEDDSASSSSDSENSEEDDIGDIDFAEGINEISRSKKKKTSRTSTADRAQPMTRAGVAYVSPEGQIFVLPEGSSDKLNPKNTTNHSSGKKQKKGHGRILSAQGLQEHAGGKLHLVAKDNEYTGQRRQEVDMKRLRELEAQERLHRLETAKMQEQITRLQRQQLERSHADLSSNNMEQVESPDIVGNFMGNQAVFYDRSSHPSGSGYMSGKTQQTNGGPGFGVSPAFHRYSMPTFPTNAGTNISGHTEPRFATTTDPANYTAHTAPLVGGDSRLGSAPGVVPYSVPSLTAQELAYLSEYMRAMGVTPPSSQQQWVMLLNSFNFTNNGNNSTASGDKSTYNYNNQIVPNNLTASGPSENNFYKHSTMNNQNHPMFDPSMLGAGSNLSQVRGTESMPLAPGNQMSGLRPALSMGAPNTPHLPHIAHQMTSLENTENSGPVNQYQSLIPDNNNIPTVTTSLTNSMGVTPARLDKVPLNGHILGHPNTHTKMPASVVAQDDGPHMVNRQSPGPANSGRDGVRTVSMSTGVPTPGVYGPIGFRQIST